MVRGFEGGEGDAEEGFKGVACVVALGGGWSVERFEGRIWCRLEGFFRRDIED